MTDHRPRGITKTKAEGGRPPRPIDVFRNCRPEAADGLEHPRRNEQISRPRKALLRDVTFEIEREHRFECFRRCHSALVGYGHDDPSADEIAFGKRGEALLKPFAVGHAIAIDECEKLASGGLRSPVSSGARATLADRHKSGAALDGRFDSGPAARRSIVGNDDFEPVPGNGLRLERAETPIEINQIVKVRNDYAHKRPARGGSLHSQARGARCRRPVSR